MDENIIRAFTYTSLFNTQTISIKLSCFLALPEKPKACLNSQEILQLLFALE